MPFENIGKIYIVPYTVESALLFYRMVSIYSLFFPD